MKWFHHDSAAHRDAKLKKVMMKYGMEGYGLYWYCVELIAHDVSEKKFTFSLEHDAEIIAHDTGIHRDRVQEMMRFMVELSLFESANGIVTCLKLLDRMDTSMVSSPRYRDLIKQAKAEVLTNNHDNVMISHDKVMQEVEVEVEVDKELLGDFPEGKSHRQPRNDVPFAAIVNLYHEILPDLPKVEKLTQTRKGYIRQRWAEDLTELSHWKNYFEYVKKSRFLMGKAPGSNGKPPFRASLEWLTKPSNYAKVAEETYHRS